MIASEDEYLIANSEAQKFEQALATVRRRGPSAGVHPGVHEAMIESLESELLILGERLARYQARPRD